MSGDSLLFMLLLFSALCFCPLSPLFIWLIGVVVGRCTWVPGVPKVRFGWINVGGIKKAIELPPTSDIIYIAKSPILTTVGEI